MSELKQAENAGHRASGKVRDEVSLMSELKPLHASLRHANVRVRDEVSLMSELKRHGGGFLSGLLLKSETKSR